MAHVRFGRLNKKWEEKSKSAILNLLQRYTDITDKEKNDLVYGASEKDLVYSGLDDTMTNACAETRLTASNKVRLSSIHAPSSSFIHLMRVMMETDDGVADNRLSHGGIIQCHRQSGSGG